nr:PREDICTED: uncharacterized protein LOC103968744 isoform X2 [Musa acuminata subsp. malaccensis]
MWRAPSSLSMAPRIPHAAMILRKENNSLGIECEPSFSINLHPDGFFIGKPTEGMLLPLLEDVPKLLHPYDRTSKILFSAIECGWLPGDMLDYIPCKYYNGTLFCEVWDFRTSLSKLGLGGCDSSHDEFPKVQKVCLRMGNESVVKDLQSISDDSWTYDDLLQVESGIIKSLQPLLYLCPKPSLDRLCRTPSSKKLDLSIMGRRLTRKQHDEPEIGLKSVPMEMASSRIIDNLKTQTSGSLEHGGLCYARNTILRSMPFIQQATDWNHSILHTLQMASQPFNISDAGCSLPVPNNAAAIPSFLLPPDHNSKNSLLHTEYCATLGKRSQFQEEVTQNTAVKRPKQGTPVSDISQAEKNVLPGIQEQRRVKLSKKQQEVQISQLVVTCDRHSCPLISETSMKIIPEVEVQMTSQLYKEAAKDMVKEEPTEAKVLCRSDLVKGKKDNLVDARSKILKQQLSVQRSLPFRLQCDKDGPSFVKHPKNGDFSRKRKSTQGYQVSAESSDQFPVSQLSENQILSLGTSRTCQEVAATKLQKEDTAVDPVASVGTASMTSVSNSTLVQVSKMILKKKPKALTSAFAEGTMGINFDTSVNATRVQDISNGSLAEIIPAPAPSEANDDTTILEKFSKIQIITQRYGLGCKKNKVDSYIMTKASSCSLLPPVGILMPEDSEEIDGSRNVCKTRILTYRRVLFFFGGSSLPLSASESWRKLVLTEFDEPCGHKVGAEIVYITDEKRFHIALLPTLHLADLFAAQFTSLMEHDGYELMNDRLEHSSSTTSDSSFSSSQHNGFPGVPLLPYGTSNMDHPLRRVTTLDKSICTTHLHHFSHKKILLPTRLTSSFAVARQQQLEALTNLGFMHQHIPNGWRSTTLYEDTSGTVNSAAFLSLNGLQQSPEQPQRILQSKVAGGGTEDDVMCGKELGQISCSKNPCQRFLNRGTSQITQAVDLAKTRLAVGPGMNVGLGMGRTSNGSGMTLNLDHALGRSNVYPFQNRDTYLLHFNRPLMDLCNNTCDPQYQLHVDLQQSLLQNLQHQQLQRLGPLEQHNLPVIPAAVSPRQLPRVPGKQVISGIVNAGIPQLSSQSVNCGGRFTKEDNHGKDTV